MFKFIAYSPGGLGQQEVHPRASALAGPEEGRALVLAQCPVALARHSVEAASTLGYQMAASLLALQLPPSAVEAIGLALLHSERCTPEVPGWGMMHLPLLDEQTACELGELQTVVPATERRLEALTVHVREVLSRGCIGHPVAQLRCDPQGVRALVHHHLSGAPAASGWPWVGKLIASIEQILELQADLAHLSLASPLHHLDRCQAQARAVRQELLTCALQVPTEARNSSLYSLLHFYFLPRLEMLAERCLPAAVAWRRFEADPSAEHLEMAADCLAPDDLPMHWSEQQVHFPAPGEVRWEPEQSRTFSAVLLLLEMRELIELRDELADGPPPAAAPPAARAPDGAELG